MKRYDISAYVDETTSWGEPTTLAVLSIDEAIEGKWVRYHDIALELFNAKLANDIQARKIKCLELELAPVSNERLKHANELMEYIHCESILEAKIATLTARIKELESKSNDTTRELVR